MHSLQDQDILVSLDDIGLDPDARKWLDGFYPAFMANSHADGKTWSVPFQRSTAVFYYSKAAFQESGLDPDKFPTTWAELGDTAAKLVKRDASGKVTRWGIKMAGDLGNAQWTFGALANQAEQKLMNDAGNEVYFNQPKTIEAMTFWRGLAEKHHATPDGVSDWSTALTRLPAGQCRDHPAHDGEFDQSAGQGAVPVRCCRPGGQEFATHRGGWRQYLLLQAMHRRQNSRRRCASCAGSRAGTRRGLVDPHGLYRDLARLLTTRRH